MDVEDLIAEEDVVVTLTHGGYVKRIPLATYRTQKRGGRGVTGMGTKETDFVENLLITTTHHTILFFTSRGLVYRLKGYDIPESARQAKGTAIVNLLPLSTGETITAVIPIKEFREDRFLFMATKKGVVKKTVVKEFDTARKGGLIAINLDEDDDLIGVRFTDGESRIILGTRDGQAIVFEEQNVRSMGRQARGVTGIRLHDMDEVYFNDLCKSFFFCLDIFIYTIDILLIDMGFEISPHGEIAFGAILHVGVSVLIHRPKTLDEDGIVRLITSCKRCSNQCQ